MPADEPITVTEGELSRALRLIANEVVGRKRRKLLVQAFLAGMLAAAIVIVPVVYFTAKANCSAISEVASASEHRFVTSKATTRNFLLQSHDRLGLTEGQFQALIAREQREAQNEIDALHHVARRDCKLV